MTIARNEAEAIAWLTRRWNEQVERYPAMREEIPLELYVQRNLKYFVRIKFLTGDRQ